MPIDQLPPVTVPAPGAAALERAIALARADLDALTAARRRLRLLVEHWQGGHRARFDEELATLDRQVERLAESVHRATVALRRVVDEAAAS